MSVVASLEWILRVIGNPGKMKSHYILRHSISGKNKIKAYPWKKLNVLIRRPRSNLLITFISSSVNSKSKRLKFCLNRDSFVLFGIAAMPRFTIHFNKICAGVLPSRLAIVTISGISRRSGISRLSSKMKKPKRSNGN